MRSSRASVASRLELPAVVAADRAVAWTGVLAGAFGSLLLARQGLAVHATAALLAGLAFAIIHVFSWNRSRRRPALQLEQHADGTLWLRRSGQAPVAACFGPRTRLVGPSVFLDVVGLGAGGQRYVRWLTPLDVPSGVLRRWTVVLLCSECVARS